MISAESIAELEAREFPYILGLPERSDKLGGTLPNVQQNHGSQAIQGSL
jgi:hypothetical protein